MIYKTNEVAHIKLKISKQIIEKHRSIINSKIEQSKKFAIYGLDSHEAVVISFLPLNSILPHEHADVYIISYTSNIQILKIFNHYLILNIISATVIFLTLLLIYTMYIKRQEAQKEKDRYHNLMDLASDGIFIMSLDGKLLEYNQQTKKLLGFSDKEMKNLCVYDWDVQIPAEEMPDVLASVTSKPKSLETKHKRKDGSTYDAFITVVKITLSNSDYIYASVRDITEYKRMQNRVMQTEKMMSVGGLAAGMAHELNNPLGGILQGIQNIQRRLKPDHEMNNKVADFNFWIYRDRRDVVKLDP